MPTDVLAARRARLLERLDPGIAILRSANRWEPGAHPQSRFRQENNFYYLTGLETPDSWLVLFNRAQGADSAVLFVAAARVGQRGSAQRKHIQAIARATAGIETVHESSNFEQELLARLRARTGPAAFERIYVLMGEPSPEIARIIDLAVETHRSISDLSRHLSALRLVKDSVELARLRRAVAITVEGQREAMKAARPELYEYELEALIEYVFRRRGAQRLGFPSIVGSGPNALILDYYENARRMQPGELLVVDVGAEYDYYTADITRTFPVSGKFSERQKELYELVLAAQEAVIGAIQPGVTLDRLDQIARRHLRHHSRGLCGEEPCDLYFTHGVVHWLGMDVHDVGDFRTTFAPGMVLSIEPGIYLEGEGVAIRIEDNVLVTEDGHEVLSSELPRSVAEIEALMARPRAGDSHARG